MFATIKDGLRDRSNARPRKRFKKQRKNMRLCQDFFLISTCFLLPADDIIEKMEYTSCFLSSFLDVSSFLS